jgi:hypothetical protein
MSPLFGLTVAPEHVAIAVLAVILTALVVRDLVRAFFRVDDKLEEIHRLFARLTKLLTLRHMPHVATVTEALSVGDLTGAIGEAKLLLRQLEDPKQSAAMLDEMFMAELPDRLASLPSRPLVLKTLGDWAVANPEAVKAAGLAIAILPK